MEDVLDKLKYEILAKLDGYTTSMRDHREYEEKLIRDLEKNKKKQEAVHALIKVAEKELEELNSYIKTRLKE